MLGGAVVVARGREVAVVVGVTTFSSSCALQKYFINQLSSCVIVSTTTSSDVTSGYDVTSGFDVTLRQVHHKSTRNYQLLILPLLLPLIVLKLPQLLPVPLKFLQHLKNFQELFPIPPPPHWLFRVYTIHPPCMYTCVYVWVCVRVGVRTCGCAYVCLCARVRVNYCRMFCIFLNFYSILGYVFSIFVLCF